ncbi:GCN5 family acetyltransferase [Arthrobacter sp. Soil736]|uniref:GNAT family N-acetyltransferase n=1 Tax=Arthrobacter sp. Soil736 TaxID=1736395 RepID=UPI0006F8548C|nr:GNAT family N-acetyltransferase [Arthrobacter sp. Soil736]KRE57730.1 GCN5 family acetyltransferase [Arthrobacter sp. Soil736]
MNFVFRPARPADYSEVRRVTRDAYLHAGHFTADHPYMSVLDNVEHRAEHAEVWVAEASGAVVAAVTLTSQGGGVGRAVVRRVIEHAQSLPGIGAISITSATFMERAHGLYESLGFQRVPARDWYVPGEDVLLWVFRLEL